MYVHIKFYVNIIKYLHIFLRFPDSESFFDISSGCQTCPCSSAQRPVDVLRLATWWLFAER